MRILRLNGWEGPVTGGAETYVQRVSTLLRSRGHTDVVASIVTSPPPVELGEMKTFQIRNSQVLRALRVNLGFPDPGLPRWLDSVVDEVRPDVIHVHHFRHSFMGLAPWLAGRKEPIVFTVHDPELVCPIATLTLPDGTQCEGGILPRCGKTGCDVGHGLFLNLEKRRFFDQYIKPRVSSFICTSEATRKVFDGLGYRPTVLIRPIIPVPDEP